MQIKTKYSKIRSSTCWEFRRTGLSFVAMLLGAASCGSLGADAEGGGEPRRTASPLTEGAGGSGAGSYLESGTGNMGDWDFRAITDNAVSQQSPGTVFATGSSITLTKYDSTSQNYAFLRFVVDNFTSIPTKAQIILFVDEGETNVPSAEGVRARVSTDAWNPGTLTWNNAPSTTNGGVGALIPEAVSPTNIPAGQELKIDVSSVVKGNGVYSFRLAWTVPTGGTSRGITFRTMQYPYPNPSQGTVDDPQCNGKFCIRLQVTGSRKAPSVQCPTPVASPSNAGALPTNVDVGLTSTINVSQGSGLVASANYPDHYYTHNDRSVSQTLGMFFMIGPVTSQATMTTRTYTVPTGSGGFPTAPIDTEEIQVGPGPKVNTSYLYLGDIGDNSHNRSSIQIFRTEEPAPYDLAATPKIKSKPVSGSTLTLVYPPDWYDEWGFGLNNQLKLNSEAFFIDPVDGSLYIIEKPCGNRGIKYANGDIAVNTIFMLPAPLPFGNTTPQQLLRTGAIDTSGLPVSKLSVACNEQHALFDGKPVTGSGPEVSTAAGRGSTGAAINRTGTAVAVTFYGKTLFWWLGPYRGIGANSWGFPDALMSINAPAQYGWQCDVTATNPATNADTDASPVTSTSFKSMREGITFSREKISPAGIHFLTTGEGMAHAIWRY